MRVTVCLPCVFCTMFVVIADIVVFKERLAGNGQTFNHTITGISKNESQPSHGKLITVNTNENWNQYVEEGQRE